MPCRAGAAVLFLAAAFFPSPCDAATPDLLQYVEQAVQTSGPLGAIVFVAAYVFATILLVPASALTIGAGYLFGPILGTALVSAGSTMGAGAAFLLSRTLARPLVESRLRGNQRFQAVSSAVSAKGAEVVLLLRLSPLFPFTLLNYGLGLSKVEFLPYIGASWIGMLPGTFAYVYLGSVGKATVDAASGGGEVQGVKLLLYVVGAIATIAATKIVSSAAAKALESTESNKPQ